MVKNISNKKIFIVLSITLLFLCLFIFNSMKSVESDDESGTMYAIIHMNAMATSGLQASDLYKQSTSLTFEFSLLEKSEYLEQWDIEILTDNKSLNRNQDLKIYIKNKKNFFKKNL